MVRRWLALLTYSVPDRLFLFLGKTEYNLWQQEVNQLVFPVGTARIVSVCDNTSTAPPFIIVNFPSCDLSTRHILRGASGVRLG